jgi:hypothetical protein
MFAEAIESTAQFTRAIHIISRNLDSNKIIAGAATLFFLNNEGYALTCKHVADVLVNAENLNKNYKAFKEELKQSNGLSNNSFLAKYNLKENSTVQMKTKFINCAEGTQNMNIQIHPTLDLALLKFNGFSKLNVQKFPIFKKNSAEIKQGKTLCRLGYPFPEFTNFQFNQTNDEIDWSNIGVEATPQFPIDGMLTRFIGDGKGKITGIEMSTPGLRGQSGGPLFDNRGLIYGMQSRTKHLHLGFDMKNKVIPINGEEKTINNYSFLHLGECIHVDVIKDFLRTHKVKFEEK